MNKRIRKQNRLCTDKSDISMFSYLRKNIYALAEQSDLTLNMPFIGSDSKQWIRMH
jgi:hypothetical protein